MAGGIVLSAINTKVICPVSGTRESTRHARRNKPKRPFSLNQIKKKKSVLIGEPKNLHCQLCYGRERVGVVRRIEVAIFLSGVTIYRGPTQPDRT